MTTRRDAWLGNAAAMLSLFGNEVTRPQSKAKSQLEVKLDHPAFMYKLFGLEHRVNRGEMVYECLHTGEKKIMPGVYGGTYHPTIIDLIKQARILPQYEELAYRQKHLHPLVWSLIYENIDVTKTGAVVLRSPNRTDQGVIYYSHDRSMRMMLDDDLLKRVFDVKEDNKRLFIKHIKLRRTINYVSIELFEDVRINLAISTYKDRCSVYMSEEEFYLLNTEGGYGFVNTCNEIMDRVCDEVLRKN